MRNLTMSLVLAVTGVTANAVKLVDTTPTIFLSQEGKQISAVEAYKSETPIYECTLKEVVFSKKTGKPKMKKID